MSEYSALTQSCIEQWSDGLLALLAGESGCGALQTPCYVYHPVLIRQRVQQIRRATPGSIALQYAVKANPNPAILSLMSELVDGFDIASTGEQQAVSKAGVAGERMSFAGPGKTDQELEDALLAGVCISLESSGEIERLAAIARRHGVRPEVLLRINPGFVIRASGMHMGGQASAFGVDEDQAVEAMEDIFSHGVDLVGLHIYAGSQSLDVQALRSTRAQSLRLMLELAAQWQAMGGRRLRVFNVGGGWGIPYFPGDQPLDLSALCESMDEELQALRDYNPEAQMVLELGRYLVGEAGIYVTRVLDKKQSFGETFLVVDGGMHQHLAASGNLGQVIRRNYPLAVFPDPQAQPGGDTARGWRKVTVSGPLCTPLDVLAKGLELPEASPGDILVVFQSGAYGLSASPQGFLSHPVASECLL